MTAPSLAIVIQPSSTRQTAPPIPIPTPTEKRCHRRRIFGLLAEREVNIFEGRGRVAVVKTRRREVVNCVWHWFGDGVRSRGASDGLNMARAR